MTQQLTFIGGGNIALAIYGGLLDSGYPPVPSKALWPPQWGSLGRPITPRQSKLLTSL